MLWVHLGSITQYHPNIPISVIYQDIADYEIKLLESVFPNVKLIQAAYSIEEEDIMKKIPLKLRHWLGACEKYPDETLYLLDCDTVICSDICNFTDGDYDVLYTWKNEIFALNTGVIILKNKNKVRKFMKHWLELTENIIGNPTDFQNAIKVNGGISQHALSQILKTKNHNGIIERNVAGERIRFKGVECKYLNETNCVPIAEETGIIHYKGGWHPILLEGKNFSKNRPEKDCKEMFEYWQQLYKKISSNSVKQFVSTSCLRHKEHLKYILDSPGKLSMLNSIMLTVYSVVRDLDIDVVIEIIGRKEQYIEILSEYFKNTPFKTISIKINYEKKRNANNLIRKIVSKHRKSKVALLFYGEEIKKEIKICKRVLSNFPGVTVSFFLNIRKTKKDIPYSNRSIIEKSFDRVFFTNNKKTTLAVVLPVSKERLPKIKRDIVSKNSTIHGKILRCIRLILKRILGKKISHMISRAIKKTVTAFSYKRN
jgi:hypothetical protein